MALTMLSAIVLCVMVFIVLQTTYENEEVR